MVDNTVSVTGSMREQKLPEMEKTQIFRAGFTGMQGVVSGGGCSSVLSHCASFTEKGRSRLAVHGTEVFHSKTKF